MWHATEELPVTEAKHGGTTCQEGSNLKKRLSVSHRTAAETAEKGRRLRVETKAHKEKHAESTSWLPPTRKGHN